MPVDNVRKTSTRPALTPAKVAKKPVKKPAAKPAKAPAALKTAKPADTFKTTAAASTARAASVAAPPPPSPDDTMKAWITNLFKQGLDRAPTAQEMANCLNFAKTEGAKGTHIFTIGAALTNLLKAGPEFKQKHPFAPYFDRVHQTHMGRSPSLEEIKNAEGWVKKRVDEGAHLFTALNETKFFAAISEEGKAYKAARPFAEWINDAFHDNLGRGPSAEELSGTEQIFAKADNVFAAGAFSTALIRQKPEFAQKFPFGPWVNERYGQELGRLASMDEIVKGNEWIAKMLHEGKTLGEAAGAFNWVLASTPEWQQKHAAPVGGGGGGGRVATGYVNGRPSQIHLHGAGDGEELRADAAAAYNRMRADAAAQGIHFSSTSGFRTMEEQQHLYNLYLQGRGNLAARPGHSNHQGGLSMDIGGVGGYGTRVYNWLAANAGRYGFVNDVRGEYWHWTFRG